MQERNASYVEYMIQAARECYPAVDMIQDHKINRKFQKKSHCNLSTNYWMNCVCIEHCKIYN